MIVPNYIPDPLEVPKNVTEERQYVRVAYVRRVTLLHGAGLLAMTGLTYLPWPRLGLAVPLVLLAAILVVLDLWRIGRRGLPVEAAVSAWALPLVLASGAWVAATGRDLGWPVGAPLAGVLCATVYTMLCGRDFSFVGCAFLALIVSSVSIAGICLRFGLNASEAGVALGANALYLLYFQYDLASLLARRRLGEEWAAVVDLYRDVFNFFGYALRVLRHWQKHRIWEIPRSGG